MNEEKSDNSFNEENLTDDNIKEKSLSVEEAYDESNK